MDRSFGVEQCGALSRPRASRRLFLTPPVRNGVLDLIDNSITAARLLTD